MITTYLLGAKSKVKEDGIFVLKGDGNSLAKALGKRDHYGHAIGMGRINVGIKYAFGKKENKDCRSRSSSDLISH